MPTITDLRTAYLFADSLQWLRLFKRHSLEVGFQIVSRTAEFVIYVPLAVVFLLGLRRISRSGWRTISEPRGALLLVAYVLLSAPVVLFVLSHLITPVFSPRYFLPSGIGLAIVLAASADALGSDNHIDSRTAPRLVWQAVVFFLLISPLLTVMALGPKVCIGVIWMCSVWNRSSRRMLPSWQVGRRILQNSCATRRNPNAQYYFLLDWPAALVGPRAFVLDYHLMQAYRNNGYYAKNIQDSHSFLCSHSGFLSAGRAERKYAGRSQ